MSEDKRLPISERLFRACLWVLGSVLVLYVTLLLLAQIWQWLLLLLGVACVVLVAIWVRLMRRNRW
ncbi:hypothetical protein [Leifsonia sp. RAF41]|uniref:hypothetical protein n=1 Tax=Leifsonia sp. RAF41 TaxID=3233056 RepID=UPI003F95A16C